jgi:hypothetical protein
LLALALPYLASAEDLILKKWDFVAMTGDSITDQSDYSQMVEMYLFCTWPDLDLRRMSR